MYKFYILLLLLLTTGFSCEKKQEHLIDLKPIYTDFENVWEERNFFGKVLEVEWYKTEFQNDKKDGKSILKLKEKFTAFGALKEITNFDNVGKLIQKDEFEFDAKEFFTKSVSTNKRASINYILTVQNDSINKTSTRNILINDSIKQVVKVFYNNKDYVIKQIAFEQNDTTIFHYKYKFNKADKIISEIQFEENIEEPFSTNEYEYDDNGNLIKFSYKTKWTEFITETEWKNERIYKKTEYTVSEDLKKYLNEVTEYDELFNPINSKTYKNSQLNRELNYQYKFDKIGNWIMRNVSMKEHFLDSNKFTPIYEENRKFKYWE